MNKRDRMTLHNWDGYTVLDLGEVEIWDGADLALLRETLTRLIDDQGCRKIGVSMLHVKYIPSGFFGMIYDWHERGVEIRLYSPQLHVQNMLWFRQFLDQLDDVCYQLRREAKEYALPPDQADWIVELDWIAEEEAEDDAPPPRKSIHATSKK